VAQAQLGSPHCRVVSDNEPCTIISVALSSSAIDPSLRLMMCKVHDAHTNVNEIAWTSVRSARKRPRQAAADHIEFGVDFCAGK
jgi:hypothetical protein